MKVYEVRAFMMREEDPLLFKTKKQAENYRKHLLKLGYVGVEIIVRSVFIKCDDGVLYF